MVRKSKSSDPASKESIYEEEALEDINDSDIFEDALKASKTNEWISGGTQRDRVIQKMLRYANEFGVQYTNSSIESALETTLVKGNNCLMYLKKFTEYVS